MHRQFDGEVIPDVSKGFFHSDNNKPISFFPGNRYKDRDYLIYNVHPNPVIRKCNASHVTLEYKQIKLGGKTYPMVIANSNGHYTVQTNNPIIVSSHVSVVGAEKLLSKTIHPRQFLYSKQRKQRGTNFPAHVKKRMLQLYPKFRKEYPELSKKEVAKKMERAIRKEFPYVYSIQIISRNLLLTSDFVTWAYNVDWGKDN